MAVKHSSIMREWPKNLIMCIFNEDEEKINHVNTYELERTLSTIPEGEFILLQYRDGLSLREVGIRLGVTHGTARSRIETGIRKMQHPVRIKMFCEK